jgi:hypothetical protein
LRLAGRKFGNAEKQVVQQTLNASLAAFRSNQADAAKLASTGAKAPPPDADLPELAAWTLVASQILNLDETITR